MSVHYKFKSGRDKHTVIFDGLHISVADLKKAIMAQRKMGKNADNDLQITNAQTQEVYESDSDLIPKNSSVEVARVPLSRDHKKPWDRIDSKSSQGANSPSHIELEKITKSSNISTSYSTEDEKIKAMMSQSTQEYDPSKYAKNRGPMGPLPSNYTCYRCGQPGHYIKQCPTNNSDIKRSTGIPRSFMIPANADQKGALLTASGEYAVPIIDHQAYKEVKKEKPPFMPNPESEKAEPVLEIPDEFKCPLCQDLLQDAVLIPCCGNSYCDECVRSLLLESEQHQCPACKEVDVSPDTLIPNRYLRTSITKFKNDTGYHKHRHNQSLNGANSTSSVPQPSEQCKPDVKQIDSEVTEDVVKSVVNIENELKVNNNIKDNNSLQITTDSLPIEDNHSTDVTFDEVLLASPQAVDNNHNGVDDKSPDILSSLPLVDETLVLQSMAENNDSVEDGTDSQQGSATGPNTPLVDEPFEAREALTDPTVQMDTNAAEALVPYPTQPLVSMAGYQRMPRMVGPIRPIRTTIGGQTNSSIMTRPQSILPHPRGVFPRPNMSGQYRPMTDSRGFPMQMTHTIPPYGYAPQMRPPYDPYGYMGPRTHMHTGPHMHHAMGMVGMGEAPPPGTTPYHTDPHYSYAKAEYDDYEDRLNRFANSLERSSRGRPKRMRRSRSRSRTNTRSSRSRSTSTSSSTSSSSSSHSSQFSFTFNGSSRSRNYNPRRRRSRSRSYRRRSRTPSPRHRDYGREYRYRRSRSPPARHEDRTRSRHSKERQKDAKHRDSRSGRTERNESSYHSSSHRSDDKKKDSKDTKDKEKDSKDTKDSKQTHSSRCHKSSDNKSRSSEQTKSKETKEKSKTTAKEESNDKQLEVKTEPLETTEPKVENQSNDTKSAQNESHSQIVDKIKAEKTDKEKSVEKESKSSREKTERSEKSKKSKDKPKKHHKHHKHRKSADEKDTKKDNSRTSSSKRSKKTKKSDDSEPIVEKISSEVVKCEKQRVK